MSLLLASNFVSMILCCDAVTVSILLDLCIDSQFAPGGLRVQFCKKKPCKWEESPQPFTDPSPSHLAGCLLRAGGSTTYPGKIVWKWWPYPNVTWHQRQCSISLCYSESRWTTGKETRDLLKTQMLLLSLDFPGQYISKFFPLIKQKGKPHSSTLSLESSSSQTILKGLCCPLKEKTHSQPLLLHCPLIQGCPRAISSFITVPLDSDSEGLNSKGGVWSMDICSLGPESRIVNSFHIHQ